jgi:hemolysin III
MKYDMTATEGREDPGRIDARPRQKPLLRGVSHEVAAFAALAGWLGLAAAAPTPPGRAAATVYGATLFVLFSASALYHRPNWPPRPRLVMRRIDHSAIFLLIAGTYTPFCLVLGGWQGRTLLAVAWGGALLGLVRAVFWPRAPRPVAAGAYLLLGWVVLPALPALWKALGTGPMVLLALGGLLYTLGAVIYAMRRPDPFPRVFGFHEVFHALVVGAAACHFVVVAAALRAIR